MTVFAPALDYDQTEQIQGAVDNGDPLAPGTYRVDGTILAGRPVYAPGVRWQRSVPAAERNAAHVRVVADHVTIHGLTVAGTNTTGAYIQAREAQHAFVLNGTTGSVLSDCAAEWVHGDAVYAGADQERWAEHWRVAGFRALLIGRQGVAVTASRDGQILGGSFTKIGRSGVDIEPFSDRFGAINTHVLGVTFSEVRNRVVAAGNGLGDVDGIFVRSCTTDGPFGVQVSPPDGKRRRRNVLVTDHVSTGTTPSVRFQNIDGLTLLSNQLRWQPRRYEGIQGLETCTGRHIDMAGPGTVRYLYDD